MTELQEESTIIVENVSACLLATDRQIRKNISKL
jgi:hypothetical protein